MLQSKLFYKTNKDKILIRQKQFRDDNKEKIKEYGSFKVCCPTCNKELRRDSLQKHNKAIHKENI